jgi:hypothetical protein
MNEETAALLRVLIYKVDNTTFGDNVPPLPLWTGPPRAIVQVQAILFASLATSLLSAFLAILGKQWLNRYASIDMGGSTIERSRHRQRKLDDIVSWYFNPVMESLPLMLQGALVLFGCALSLYLWEINTTVARVVLGATLFGLIFYSFIVVQGVVSPSFPYQTPAAGILRNIPYLRGVLRSAILPFMKGSVIYLVFIHIAGGWGKGEIATSIFISFTLLISLPVLLVMDVIRIIAYTISISVVSVMSHRRPEQHTAALDPHSISWTLRTSLDRPVRLSALNYLTITTLPGFDPTLVASCFDVFFGCIEVTGGNVVINQGSEELATISAMCCLHTLSYLRVTYPLPGSLDGIRGRYTRVFQPRVNFNSLPFSQILGVINRVFYPTRPGRMRYLGTPEQETLYTWSTGTPQQVRWENYTPSNGELVIVACALTRLARFENWRRGNKVPRWLLAFTLRFLSQDPLPPTSIAISCLSIIAIDLGCDVPETMTSDDGCVYI